jgi:hypothetical protein
LSEPNNEIVARLCIPLAIRFQIVFKNKDKKILWGPLFWRRSLHRYKGSSIWRMYFNGVIDKLFENKKNFINLKECQHLNLLNTLNLLDFYDMHLCNEILKTS